MQLYTVYKYGSGQLYSSVLASLPVLYVIINEL